MAEEVEVHLSFWPIGIVGGKGNFHSAAVSLDELAGLCASKEDGCPMGCFPCPFEKKCVEVGLPEWKALLGIEEPAKDTEDEK